MNTERQRDSQPGAGVRRVLLRYTGMGLELAAALIGLTLVGWWVDRQFRTEPVGILVGAGLGIVGGMYNFIRAALHLSRAQAAEQRREQSTHGHDREHQAPD